MDISKRATANRTVIVDLVKAAAATMKEGNTNLPLRNHFLLHSVRYVFQGATKGMLSIYR